MKKEKYLASILKVLLQDGLGLSMEVIAQKIGVTKKTLYNRFSSKEHLMDECLGLLADRFERGLDCMDDVSVPVQERFGMGIVTLRTFFKDISPVFIRDLMVYYPQKASMEHSTGLAFFEMKLERNIREGRDFGVYRPDVDSGLLARYIAYSVFSFFRKEVMLANTYSADHYFKQVIDFNVNALLIK